MSSSRSAQDKRELARKMRLAYEAREASPPTHPTLPSGSMKGPVPPDRQRLTLSRGSAARPDLRP